MMTWDGEAGNRGRRRQLVSLFVAVFLMAVLSGCIFQPTPVQQNGEDADTGAVDAVDTTADDTSEPDDTGGEDTSESGGDTGADGGVACESDTDCDDGLDCTEDICRDGTCEFSPFTNDGCCGDAEDCRRRECHTVRCSDRYTCEYEVATDREGCCRSDDHCDDGNACTTDRCSDSSPICQFEPLDCPANKTCRDGACLEPAECSTDGDCVDDNPCTRDVCNSETKQCEHQTKEGCCTVDGECGNGRLCDTDLNSCVECIDSGDCSDNDQCTANRCKDGTCTFPEIEDCCTSSRDCSTGERCRNGTCNG